MSNLIMQKVIVRAPASIANFVCGFDILGMSLDEPFDEMKMELTNEPGIVIRHTDAYGLSEDPSKNVAGVALQAMLDETDKKQGVVCSIQKNIKPGSGLGSSAASAAGAVAGLNRLLGNPFSNSELVKFAMTGEKLASGVKHADNISPCLYGGITLIRSIHPLDIVPLNFPSLFISVVHPQVEVKTSDARQILRKQVLLKDAIRQWGNIAGLVTGLNTLDVPLISRSMEDVIIEPVRSILIPAFHEIKKASMDAGALGGGIAGSGPSIFMLSRNRDIALAVEDRMSSIYNRMGLDCKTYVTTVNREGIRFNN